MKTLEEQVIRAYAAAGSTLSHRFPMDHIVPDVARCVRCVIVLKAERFFPKGRIIVGVVWWRGDGAW